jgi:tetratricopeptide (TPR) repeat protein
MEPRLRWKASLWAGAVKRRWTHGLLLGCLLLAACGHLQESPPPPPDDLFAGVSFPPPGERIGADEVFAVSEAMAAYLRSEVLPRVRTLGRQGALVNALYRAGRVRLEYDAAMTRNAMQAFDAHAGNCLSLVILTAAFAKALDLPVTYQSAYLEESWSRSGNLLLRSGHVNVTLSHRFVDTGTHQGFNPLTIDFLPPEDLRGLRTRPIGEATVLAMYMNNRAAEALADGRLADAHAWARAAIGQDAGFLSAYNTLGVVYLRHGDRGPAERVFRHLLDRQPDHTQALHNLAQALQQQDRTDEAAALQARLQRLEPHPPFHFFQLGLAALRDNDVGRARELFAREAARDPHYHEFQFWLAVANYRLGDLAQAHHHLARALEASSLRRDRDLYAAKLAWLRAHAQPSQP